MDGVALHGGTTLFGSIKTRRRDKRQSHTSPCPFRHPPNCSVDHRLGLRGTEPQTTVDALFIIITDQTATLRSVSSICHPSVAWWSGDWPVMSHGSMETRCKAFCDRIFTIHRPQESFAKCHTDEYVLNFISIRHWVWEVFLPPSNWTLSTQYVDVVL